MLCRCVLLFAPGERHQNTVPFAKEYQYEQDLFSSAKKMMIYETGHGLYLGPEKPHNHNIVIYLLVASRKTLF